MTNTAVVAIMAAIVAIMADVYVINNGSARYSSGEHRS